MENWKRVIYEHHDNHEKSLVFGERFRNPEAKKVIDQLQF
jgi:hypothetical protein